MKTTTTTDLAIITSNTPDIRIDWVADAIIVATDIGQTTFAPGSFDRAAHCRKIASYGGHATLAKHGVAHFRAIGTAGAAVTIERHGLAYFRSLAKAKGWSGARTPDLAADLKAGRALASGS